jgi:hypothetical protein
VESVQSSKQRLVNVIRWIARALGACIILFYTILFTLELVSSGVPTYISAKEVAVIALVGMEVIGLGLAIAKWELWGGVITLLAFVGKNVFYPVMFRFVSLTPVTAILFLVSWWLTRSSQFPRPRVDQTR